MKRQRDVRLTGSSGPRESSGLTSDQRSGSVDLERLSDRDGRDGEGRDGLDEHFWVIERM